VLSGEPGIGKTILWERGVEGASERVGRVLSCRGVEAEASFSFAGLSELLAPVLEEAAPLLAPPRLRALEVALLLAEPGDVAPDAHAIGLAVLDVLRCLSEQKPVLVGIDDMQWLDTASASVLQIALRRLRQEPIGFLATLRTAPDTSAAFELDRSFPAERLEQLELGPLSLAALHHLLRERLGLELSRPELVRVREAAGGNPFFALELGRELLDADRRTAAGRGFQVPESLRAVLGGRMARLPTETGDVLLIAAALARPTVDLVAAAHGDREAVLETLDFAARESVVELDGPQLRFTHPLLASICYEQAPLWKRHAVHRVLAAVVIDVEERARHLALAADGPDTAVARELDAAAKQAAARGALAAAADLSELAGELTPGDPALDRERRLRAAALHRLAGNAERAASMLEQLLVEVPSGSERADVLFELASTERPDTQTRIELLDEASAHAADDDVRSARILAFRSLLHTLTGAAGGALTDARAAMERAERVSDPALIATAIASLGITEGWAGEGSAGLLEHGAEIEHRLGLILAYNESPRYVLSRLQLRQGETDRARTVLEELEATAAARGDEYSRVQILWSLGLLEWSAGHWPEALDHVTAAYDLTEQTQFGHSRAWVGRVKALIEADLGLVDKSRASAREALASAGVSKDDLYGILSLGALGRVELMLGDLEAAGSYLRELPGRLLAAGAGDPTVPVWADAIETLVGLGELEFASGYLDAYEEHAGRLGSPWALAAAWRCRGLLAAAEGDHPSSFEAFERSLGYGEAFPLERGRTLLCLGGVRRQAQQKRAAREALEQAIAVFDQLGAPLWAEKARAELSRISGRRASSDELTETERLVAELAAQGRTNKQIATELFLGQSTVEAHLSRVYRKLGVRRTELSGALAIPAGGAAKAEGTAAQA
jgi:DNA-binding CsgD family transcriptional regulator